MTNLTIDCFCDGLTVARLCPHNTGSITLRPDRYAPDKTITLYTHDVAVMARLALALADTWPDDLMLFLEEGGEGNEPVQMRTVTDHGEIRRWLHAALPPPKAPEHRLRRAMQLKDWP